MGLESRWWWDLTTQDFADIDAERVVAILPVDAVEQHGPHLPVRVDAAINAGIIARAVELMPPDCPAPVLPMLPVGKSDEHLAFPGTLTFSHETLARVRDHHLCHMPPSLRLPLTRSRSEQMR
jgi:creatinine amidohydrolase